MIDRVIILPYGEEFNENSAGAAGIFVKESLRNEKIKKYKQKFSFSFIIYGSAQNVYKRFKKIYVQSGPEKKFFSNANYIQNFINKFEKKIINNIEIHNRPAYAKKLIEAFPSSKIFIFYHNDPRKLRGSKSVEERNFLKNRCTNIFLSKYIKNCFYSGLKKKYNKNTDVIYPGVKKITKIKNKKKIIVFTGKLNEAKGYDLFIKAADNIKKDLRFKEWKFLSLGSEKRRTINRSSNVKELGFYSNNNVSNLYKLASIAIAPSKWDEPLGRLPIEAGANGCITISSDKGGLIESNKNGIIIKNIDENKITNILKKICLDKNLTEKHNKLLKKFNFTDEKFQKNIKRIRSNNTNIKNILHIANFNFKNKKRLFYSFSNKINLGIKENNYKLFAISDRDFLRSNRKLTDFFGSLSFNRKIIHIVKNRKIDFIILGHTQKIFKSTFIKLREINKNIVIVKLYIDSISPEFFNFNKNFYDFKYLNKIFVTSDVTALNIKYGRKFSFLQYPVHKKIDYLKSFNNAKKTIDVFYATSHGINRGVLKKGKKDERYDFINYLNKNLRDYRCYFPGFNNAQPIWGKNFYRALYNSLISINYSRGKFKKLYTSDRLSSLIGNGCFVINEKKNLFYKKFNNTELVNFKNRKDLLNKIKYYLKNKNLVKTIAKNCYYKYHNLYNAKKVVKKIITLDNF
jgi:glycosyltransferase involved in cell wall biosynthesis